MIEKKKMKLNLPASHKVIVRKNSREIEIEDQKSRRERWGLKGFRDSKEFTRKLIPITGAD